MGLDDYFTRDFANNIGAEIMGRNKFGPQRGPWADEEWKGWWGDEPPFHTPVFVLTHHVRPSFAFVGHHVPLPRRHARRSVASGEGGSERKDVRLGGGVATVREFLDADLVDTMHVAVAPLDLEPAASGSGRRTKTCSTGSTSTWCRVRGVG